MGGKAPRVAKHLPQSHSQIVSDADPGSYVSKSRAHTLKLLSLVHGDDESIAGLPVSPNPGVTADVAGLTHAGMVRSSNQDQFLIAGLERALLVEDSSLPAGPGTRLGERPQGRIFIVADGIGGHGGGEVASAVATDAMAHYAFAAMPWVLSGVGATPQELVEGLQDAMASAQARMRRVAHRKGINQDLGTTLTMAYVAWPNLFLVQLVDGNAMTEEEAKRSRFSHVLVNAVGGQSDDLHVELNQISLAPGDQLLLCSDGLYDMLDDDQIAAHLLEGNERPVADVVRALVDAANAAGGRDNVTVVVARF